MSECPACGWDTTSVGEGLVLGLGHRRGQVEELARQMPQDVAAELAELLSVVDSEAIREVLDRRGTGGL